MSLLRALGQKKAAKQINQGERPVVYQQNLADSFRIRQMEKVIQQANTEIEQLKERLSRLEQAFAKRSGPARIAIEEVEDSSPAPITPPLAITDLKELAAMAKRFR